MNSTLLNRLENGLKQAASKIQSEKGPFLFFGIALREEGIGKWDVLVAAPWIDEDKYGALQYIVREIQKEINPDDFYEISRIVPLQSDHPMLRDFVQETPVHLGGEYQTLPAGSFWGVPIEKGIVMVSGSAAA